MRTVLVMLQGLVEIFQRVNMFAKKRLGYATVLIDSIVIVLAFFNDHIVVLQCLKMLPMEQEYIPGIVISKWMTGIEHNSSLEISHRIDIVTIELNKYEFRISGVQEKRKSTCDLILSTDWFTCSRRY
jgi:hypothetical protein